MSGVSHLDIGGDDSFRYQLRRDPMMFGIHSFAQSAGVAHFPYVYQAVGVFLPILGAVGAYVCSVCSGGNAPASWKGRFAKFALASFLAVALTWSGHYLFQATVVMPNLTGALFFGAGFIVAHQILSVSNTGSDWGVSRNSLATLAL